jgi:hypothetical protein
VRAGTVKVGRRFSAASRSIVSRPRLDRPEHGRMRVVVGMTRPRGVRYRARATRAATLHPAGHNDLTMIHHAHPRRRSLAAGPFY